MCNASATAVNILFRSLEGRKEAKYRIEVKWQSKRIAETARGLKTNIGYNFLSHFPSFTKHSNPPNMHKEVARLC